jgi:hypothetical protein
MTDHAPPVRDIKEVFQPAHGEFFDRVRYLFGFFVTSVRIKSKNPDGFSRRPAVFADYGVLSCPGPEGPHYSPSPGSEEFIKTPTRRRAATAALRRSYNPQHLLLQVGGV